MWEQCKDIQSYLVKARRELHEIPELGKDLPKTSEYIAKELDRMGIKYKRNTKDSGIIALIEGRNSDKVIALRADMDALPIKEETGLDFASTNGNMHASWSS